MRLFRRSNEGLRREQEEVQAGGVQKPRGLRRVRAWSLPAKLGGVVVLLATAAGLGVLLWVAVGMGGSGRQTPAAPPPKIVQEVYARALASISKSGQILHASSTFPDEKTKDGKTVTPKTEVWIDGRADAIRLAITNVSTDPPGQLDTGELLITGKYEYQIMRNPSANGGFQVTDREDFKPFCPGSDKAAIAVLFGCFFQAAFLGNGNTPATPRIQAGAFEGRKVIEFLTSITFSQGNRSAEYRRTLYLDPATALPLASNDEYLADGHSLTSIAGRYVYEFLDRGKVDRDLFNPHAIGYGIKNAAQLLDALAKRTPIYWLGEDHEFEPGVCQRAKLPPHAHVVATPSPGSCPVVLRQVISDTSDGSDGKLVYAFEIYIDFWRPGYLAEFANTPGGRMLNNPQCASKSELSIRGRNAVVYILPAINYPLITPPPGDPCTACFPPTRGGPLFDGVIAFIDYGDVVVEVNGIGAFQSANAIEAVLDALQRR